MAIITVPILVGTAIATGGIGFGFGLFSGAQADDAIEVATGEKDTIPVLPIILLLVVLALLWRFVGPRLST